MFTMKGRQQGEREREREKDFLFQEKSISLSLPLTASWAAARDRFSGSRVLVTEMLRDITREEAVLSARLIGGVPYSSF